MEEVATLTVKQTAKYLGIGYNKAYELVKGNIIPNLMIGNQYKIPKVGLNEWIEKSTKNRVKVGH